MTSLPEKLPPLEGLSHQEKDALIQVLWDQVQVLTARVKELETQLKAPKKTTRNASVPPSRSPKGNLPNPVKLGEYGKKRNVKKVQLHRLGGRALHPNPDRIVVAKAKCCPHCAHELGESAQSVQAVYDKIELPPIRPIVTQVSQYGGCCPSCGEGFRAPVPLGLNGGSPFGESVQTLATYLRYSHAIGYRRLGTMFGTVLGLSISEGGLANVFKGVKRRLDGEVEEILARCRTGTSRAPSGADIRKSRLVCSDETGARVQGENQWEWVFQNEQCAVHVIRPSRGAKVIDEVLGEHRPEVWVSDLYSAQKNHPAERWQVCLAHQLRDCQYAVEAGDTVFAKRMKRVLLRAFVIHRKRERLAASTLAHYRWDLKRRLAACLALAPEHKEGRRLKKRYLKIQDHLFLFLDDASIPPTNNSSEQALRMSTVFRKVTNCFRSEWGRDLFAAVRSVVNTGKRQGLSEYQAIQRALSSTASLFDTG